MSFILGTRFITISSVTVILTVQTINNPFKINNTNMKIKSKLNQLLQRQTFKWASGTLQGV